MKRSSPVAYLACAVLFLAGCGRDNQETEVRTDNAATPPATNGQESKGELPPGSGRAIEITGNDAMKFSVTEIRATPGEALTVTLRNIGTMPKFSMGHNWVLLKKDANVNTFLEQAANAATNDYVPPDRRSDILAHTKLLGPKETDSVTFKAPTEPGRYIFLCSFPGHFQVGMKGELIVE